MSKPGSNQPDASDQPPISLGSSTLIDERPDSSVEVGLGDEQPEPSVPFPIVGVGASAGGLEAVTQLLRALPVDTGASFVIIQHLAPDHASNLAEILSRSTLMPVCEVHDVPNVEPDHVYVIPPGRDMIIEGGTLYLRPRIATYAGAGSTSSSPHWPRIAGTKRSGWCFLAP